MRKSNKISGNPPTPKSATHKKNVEKMPPKHKKQPKPKITLPEKKKKTLKKRYSENDLKCSQPKQEKKCIIFRLEVVVFF